VPAIQLNGTPAAKLETARRAAIPLQLSAAFLQLIPRKWAFVPFPAPQRRFYHIVHTRLSQNKSEKQRRDHE
jgi:hypothetical protein